MRKKILIFSFFLKIFYLINGEIFFDVDPKKHLELFQEYRNPVHTLVEPWLSARKYIKEKFQEMDLTLETQIFNTTVPTKNNSLVQVEGENIIGTLKSGEGKGVLLVGVNYDTPLEGCPLRTGVSVAIMLEAAQVFLALRDVGKIVQKVDIIFVAFDVSLKKYTPSSLHLDGSSLFVDKWLSKELIGKEFLGAIILDSIGNYNLERKSQFLPQGMSVTFPEAFREISSSGFVGDFLTLLTRDTSESSLLASIFSDTFSEESSEHDFSLQEFLLRDGAHLDPVVFNIISKHSQYAFWEADRKPLPAILLTDMEATRKPPDGDVCANVCAVDDFWTASRRNIVVSINKAVVRTLIGMQEHQVTEKGESSGTSSQSRNFQMLTVSLAVLFLHCGFC